MKFFKGIASIFTKYFKFLRSKGMRISAQELQKILNFQNVNVVLPDREYYLENEETIQDIIKSDKVDQMKYRAEAFDCDDFAFLLKARFTKEAYKNNKRRAPYAFGIVYGKNKQGGHAVNIYVNNKKEVHLIEPQTDRETSLDDVFFVFI